MPARATSTTSGASGPRGPPTFARSPGIAPVQATSFMPVGDDVLVRLELRGADGTSKEIWSLCQFNGTTLVRAMNFESRAEALTHAA